VAYWGQNSFGAVDSNQAGWQKPISYYCQDDSIDVFPIAFVNQFFGTVSPVSNWPPNAASVSYIPTLSLTFTPSQGGLPALNLANSCNPTDNGTFPGTGLANCQALASEITACQAKGAFVRAAAWFDTHNGIPCPIQAKC
jgi:chitinase